MKVIENPSFLTVWKLPIISKSLINTWSGQSSEKWNKDTSSLILIMIAIQSSILTEQPYFNIIDNSLNIMTKLKLWVRSYIADYYKSDTILSDLIRIDFDESYARSFY